MLDCVLLSPEKNEKDIEFINLHEQYLQRPIYKGVKEYISVKNFRYRLTEVFSIWDSVPNT